MLRFDVDLGAELAGAPVISPDGSRLVFVMNAANGKRQLATRLMAETKSTLLSGADNIADQPFFSPDGQSVGFFADGHLKTISVRGGAPVELCEAPAPSGGSWGEDGYIVASLRQLGLSRIPEKGGKPERLTDAENGELLHSWPQVLPGGDTVLFTSSPTSRNYDDAVIEAVSVKTQERRVLHRGGYFGRYLPTSGQTGHLVFIRERTLYAVEFDPRRLEVRGTPVPVLEDFAEFGGASRFMFSQTGLFLYPSGASADRTTPILWLDSEGKAEPLLPASDRYAGLVFSPDGGRLAAITVGAGTRRDVIVYDWRKDILTRLVSGEVGAPAWTPNGKWIFFRTFSSEGSSISVIPSDGSAEPQRLLEGKNLFAPYSVSSDGRYLTYFARNAETYDDIWILPLDTQDPDHPKRSGDPWPFVRTKWTEREPEFSPDGRWIAYSSNESGTRQVWVRSFRADAKEAGPGRQISVDGGIAPVWSPKTSELFYIDNTTPARNTLMVVDYTVDGAAFNSGKPRVWSALPLANTGGGAPYDVAPDGKRLAILPSPVTDPRNARPQLTLLLNFFDELRRKVHE